MVIAGKANIPDVFNKFKNYGVFIKSHQRCEP